METEKGCQKPAVQQKTVDDDWHNCSGILNVFQHHWSHKMCQIVTVNMSQFGNVHVCSDVEYIILLLW